MLPSHEMVPLPALSPTMEVGTIKSWEVKVGDSFEEGDILCEVETDKAVVAFEAVGVEGYIAAILKPEGSKDIKVGEMVCVVVEEEGDVAAFKDFKVGDAPAAAAPAASAGVAAAAAVAAPVVQTGDRLKASPYAKKLASEKNVPLNQLAGSGPGGRIVANDVNSYVPSAAPAAAPVQAAAAAPVAAPAGLGAGDFTDLDLTNMRKTIASRLCESKNSIPHYYLTRTIRTDAINELRGQLNQISDVKISVNDFIIKAASLACLKVPEANSAWMGDTIRQYNVVDMSVAVATPNGLITPIVFDSHTKGLAQISSDVKRLAAKARDGKLQPAEFVGGTFTISNLGMMGIDHFTAIINPPQSCILAVGGNTQRLIPSDNNEKGFEVVTEMKVTLSCDHRTVDGAVGAQWLKHFAEFIENPITMHLYP